MITLLLRVFNYGLFLTRIKRWYQVQLELLAMQQNWSSANCRTRRMYVHAYERNIGHGTCTIRTRALQDVCIYSQPLY